MLKTHVIAFSLLASLSASALANDWKNDYQRNTLFNPTEHQLERESRGFVLIYDGMTDEEVEKALDQYPGRIEAMMFVRVQKTDPETGDVVTEEDGCD